MDRHFENPVSNFVVPKEHRLQPPKGWLKWEISVPESLQLPNKYFMVDENPTQEELNFNGQIFHNDIEMELHAHDKARSSGSSEESLPQTALSYEQPDYQLDGLVEIEQMDDMFLSTLLEDLRGTDHHHKSFSFSPESWSTTECVDDLTDMVSDLHSMFNDTHDIGSSKYLKTHAFSPSEIPISQPSPAKILVPSEYCPTNGGHVDDETSIEESVLQELEMVMAQLTDKTRICFRDALYRLAKNSSEQTATPIQNGVPSMEIPSVTSEDKQMRSGEKKTMELETNAIDRAIANLMFNKMELNIRDFPVSASADSEQENVKSTRTSNDILSQPQLHSGPYNPIFPGDAEVPILGQGYHQLTTGAEIPYHAILQG